MPIKIHLTDDQQEQVSKLIDKSAMAYCHGKPGIVIAQVFADHMLVGFMSEDKAKQFEKTAIDWDMAMFNDMTLTDYLEDQHTRNFWTYFPDIPVGSIFSFGGPTEYKKTGNETYREHCSYDRSQRIYAENDHGKLLKVVKIVQRWWQSWTG